MKKAFVFILLLSLILTGCSRTAEEITQPEDSIQLNSIPTPPTALVEPKTRLETTPTTIPTEYDTVTTTQEDPTTVEETKKDPGTKSKKADDSKQEPKPTVPASTKKSKPSAPSKKKEPKPTVTTPTRPSEENVETPSTEATQPEKDTTPTEPEPSPTKPTEPETLPTKPAPTEPTGCSHDWKTIHHKEKGHWKAGIVCDCGWTVYGNSDEVVSKWNAHSASYPPEESLFEHGGYGSADEWVVDKPAYDERVCRHCGEVKS